jgi:hypothetical protein
VWANDPGEQRFDIGRCAATKHPPFNLEKAVGCAVTQEAKASQAQNLSVHAVCELLTSGQLLFLGSSNTRLPRGMAMPQKCTTSGTG